MLVISTNIPFNLLPGGNQVDTKIYMEKEAIRIASKHWKEALWVFGVGD